MSAKLLDGLELFEIAIIVIADAHNPTLLHPEFLRSRSIVPESWEILDESIVCSLPLSALQFRNGVSIQVEPNRLQIRQSDLTSGPEDTWLPKLAAKYIEALPAVRYSAVGLNFAMFLSKPNSAEWLRHRFVKSGPWSAPEMELNAVGLKFRYSRIGMSANIQVDQGRKHRAHAGESDGLVVRLNYHHDLRGTEQECLKQALSAFSRFAEVASDVATLTRIALEEKS